MIRHKFRNSNTWSGKLIIYLCFLFLCAHSFGDGALKYIVSGESDNIVFTLDILNLDQASLSEKNIIALNANLKNNGNDDLKTNGLIDSCSMSIGGNMVAVNLYSINYNTKYPKYLLAHSSADFKIIIDVDPNLWQFKTMALKLFLDSIKEKGGLNKITPAEKKKFDDEISQTVKGIFTIGMVNTLTIKFDTKIIDEK